MTIVSHTHVAHHRSLNSRWFGLALMSIAGFGCAPAPEDGARWEERAEADVDAETARGIGPSELYEVCNDGIDNDRNGIIDRESPVDDGYHRYKFQMRVSTQCEEYEIGSGGVEDVHYTCQLTDTVQLNPGKDPSFIAENPACDGLGLLIVEGKVNNKGKLGFDISTPWFDASHKTGALCDGELWNLNKPDKDWLEGHSGAFEKGDCDTFGWCADCKSYWTIDIVPEG